LENTTRRKTRAIMNMETSVIRSLRDVRGSGRKLLLSTLPLVGSWWCSRLLLGMFLELLRFFMGESERAIVEPHERLARIRHLGRSARNGSIRFTVFVGVRNALMITIDINGHISRRNVNHPLTTSRLARFLPRSLGVGTVYVVFAGVLAFESSGVGGTAGV